MRVWITGIVILSVKKTRLRGALQISLDNQTKGSAGDWLALSYKTVTFNLCPNLSFLRG
jgi:hypothetical protein